MNSELGTHEILRVTSEGQFIWHLEADAMLEDGDFSHSPALPHILKALKEKRTWQCLTEEEVVDCWPGIMLHPDCAEFWKNIEAKLKAKNEH